MKVSKINVFFDVRTYNSKLPKEQWKIKSGGEQITATATFAVGEEPNELKGNEHGREYERNGEKRIAYKFKIGANCRFYKPNGGQIDRPSNEDLEANRWMASIVFRSLAKDPKDDKKPCGLWASDIMLRKQEFNPFADEVEAEDVIQEQEQVQEQEEQEQEQDDLPF